jgi:hypothetical protein
MEIINRHNYESFFLDYLEGNLTAEKEKELIDFIEANPDLKEELNGWEDIKVASKDQIIFPGKSSLKKTDSVFPMATPFEEQCIAKLEGDLNKREGTRFDQELKEDNSKHKTYKIYEKTRLLPDYSIVYPNKNDLKTISGKDEKLFKLPFYTILASAASIALIVGLFFNTKTDQTKPYKNYTELTSIKVLNTTDKSSFSKNLANITINNYNNTKDLYIDYDNLLPIVKPENLNNFYSSYTSIKKLSPVSISKLNSKPVFKNQNPGYEQTIANNISSKQIGNNNKSLLSVKSSMLDTKSLIANKGHRNFSILDLADLGFKGISNLTGKDIALERKYNKNGELKRLAFKTESFSISTKVKK